ncbi:rho-N domain-containing protein 1, chloroplastic isoform X2 [Argentina anserina]|uniref:rho-N domain-containing protein 1, chloroplastic isoform X2 n=1 Tax=Argentina anserina TaxID=57926 RepID=UPI0021766191|nr:rho-N domain-containing protein 1, chloroplastic isoform X2 [Potentilla anserina]
MGGIVYQYRSVLHFPTFSSFSKQPKLGKSIFSIRDVSSTFERKGVKLSVSCVGSEDGNRRGQSSRRSSGSGRTTRKNDDESRKPRGGRKSKSSNQEEIISLFRRIQSSISKEVESVDTKKIKSDASEEKPPSAASILSVLQGGTIKQTEEANQGEKVDTKEQQILQANPLVADFKLTRPSSKFVKRSPIPSSSHMSRQPGDLDIKHGASLTPPATKELELERVEEMKLPELKELAKSRGLRGYSKLKKRELVELLKS